MLLQAQAKASYLHVFLGQKMQPPSGSPDDGRGAVITRRKIDTSVGHFDAIFENEGKDSLKNQFQPFYIGFQHKKDRLPAWLRS